MKTFFENFKIDDIDLSNIVNEIMQKIERDSKENDMNKRKNSMIKKINALFEALKKKYKR